MMSEAVVASAGPYANHLYLSRQITTPAQYDTIRYVIFTCSKKLAY